MQYEQMDSLVANSFFGIVFCAFVCGQTDALVAAFCHILWGSLLFRTFLLWCHLSDEYLDAAGQLVGQEAGFENQSGAGLVEKQVAFLVGFAVSGCCDDIV